MAEAPSKRNEKQDKDDDDDGSKGKSVSDYMSSLFVKLKVGGKTEETVEKVLDSPDVDSVVKFILSGKCKNIVTMAGAGISTSAGIPDFRSPGTGLYDNLASYNLPYPTAIFELSFFMENPEPFFVLAKSLYPGTFRPTLCHYFLRLLQDKGLLLRHYTQNIDTLERVAGLSGEKLVEAHGTFHTSHCIGCRKLYSLEWVKEQIFNDVVPKCVVDGCEGIVKPDIVFFGEALPERFFKCGSQDFPRCDLLIIMGTSLVVQPFASLSNRVAKTTPRLYVNLENMSSEGSDSFSALFRPQSFFKFDDKDNYRDVFLQGTCDDGCRVLAEKLGWKDELEALIKTETAKLDDSDAKADSSQTGTRSAPLDPNAKM